MMYQTAINLVPDIPNPTPDYYCTWQTQLYATNDGKPQGQRAIIGEKALFDKEKPYGWAYFYEKARRDLLFVMDDSWDVPPNNDPAYFGSLVLDREKFPSFTQGSTNAQALKRLSDKLKEIGWKGLGGWVCAQESGAIDSEKSPEAYWKQRLAEADEAGFSYWKVDWGCRGDSAEFRSMLTKLARTYAPHLIVEHAKAMDSITFSDVFRTYDVPAIMSIPMTIQKIAELAANLPSGSPCLINSEDEVYTAAALGFTMGVMRHPYSGAFCNGKADMSFPEIHRNLKTKLYEVVRAARFHRIAPAFPVGKEQFFVSDTTLSDSWQLQDAASEIEAWWFENPTISACIAEGTLTKSAPSSIARNTQLPIVTPDANGNVPFVVASRNPNGVYAVATLGRTSGRTYGIPKCDVTIHAGDATTIGAFGEYDQLIINTDVGNIKRILVQDLADTAAFDITEAAVIGNGEIRISGEILSQIGTRSQPENDTSEPGVVIRLE